jgi:hypothetical protein
MAESQTVQISGSLAPEGGGLPIHATLFQVLVDTSEVTFVFLQRVLEYTPDAPTPKVSHRVVGQIATSHMLAKDLNIRLTKALGEFEIQYPIPEIVAPLIPPSA